MSYVHAQRVPVAIPFRGWVPPIAHAPRVACGSDPTVPPLPEGATPSTREVGSTAATITVRNAPARSGGRHRTPRNNSTPVL